MIRPLQHRKAFTLLEVLISCTIMAVLTYVTIPSLLSVVRYERAVGDSASAIALADQAYYDTLARDRVGTGSFVVPYSSITHSGLTSVTGTNPVVFNFTDGNAVSVDVGNGTDNTNPPALASTTS